jgi:hypothetical protein
MEIKFRVVIGGTKYAKGRWLSRSYKHKSSAQRRVNKIRNAHDTGVATIWILRMKEF